MPRPGQRSRTAKEPIVICISGMAGSGKSTVAKEIAKKYGLRYFSGGLALKTLALKKGYKPLQKGWWESSEGLRFLRERGKDLSFDKQVDEKLLEEAKRGKVVLDSWTMPWLSSKGFKIFLEASPDKRAQRIARRDRITVKQAVEALEAKEQRTKAIYKKLYGFSLGEDFTPFHLILDTDTLNEDEVFLVLCRVLDSMVISPKRSGS